MRKDWHAARNEFYAARFQALAERALAEALRLEAGECFWLLAPSSYVVKTGGAVWGVDLFSWPGCEISEKALESVDFLLVTHGHGDHYDPPLLEAFAKSGGRIVLPAYLADRAEKLAVGEGQLGFVSPGERFSLGGADFLAFDSLHFRPDTGAGIPEIGFRAEVSGGALLFPGDVRDYRPEALRPFPGAADTVFAHVWLGDEGGDKAPDMEVLDRFAAFYAAFAPKKVFLTHLYRSDRALPDMWTYAHAGLAMDAVSALLPEAEIVIPQLGKRYDLF